MEKHQGVTHQLLAALGHEQLRVGAADHPLKTGTVEPVSGKALLFKLQQCG